MAGTAFYSNTSNFVSFASPALSQPLTSPFNAVPAPSHLGDARSVDSKSTLFESAESKYTRLRTFANHLKHAIEEAQHRTGNEENDHAIEYIYQIGTQQRLFVDYRPDDLANQSHSYTAHTKSFETQTFFGQLHVDEVHICSGQGTNKKLCKRHCFQQALDLFLNEDFDVKVSSNNDRRHQYELIQKQPSHRPTDFDGDEHQDTGVFSIPSTHPMANTKINFVHALDTSTMAGRTARQQSQLERQYWQQCGRGVPRTFRPTRIHRSISPPPPVPHQSIPEPPTTVIEAVSTTPASVAVRPRSCSSPVRILVLLQATIAQMERAADQQQRSADVRHLRYPFPGKALGDQVGTLFFHSVERAKSIGDHACYSLRLRKGRHHTPCQFYLCLSVAVSPINDARRSIRTCFSNPRQRSSLMGALVTGGCTDMHSNMRLERNERR